MNRAAFLLGLVACTPPPATTAPVTPVDIPPAPPASAVDLPPPDPPHEKRVTGEKPVGPFDKIEATNTLERVSLKMCATPYGPRGPGHVDVIFAPDGTVSSATVDSAPYAGTREGGCIAAAFGTAHVAPFTGAPVRVGKSFFIP